MKEIILLSGTRGVGKSTFGESLQASGLAFVKPEEGANTEGQRAALAQKREFYLNNGISFAYECESLSEVEAIAKEAKTHGFATHLLFWVLARSSFIWGERSSPNTAYAR